MSISAIPQLRVFLPRLKAWMKDSGFSVREVARMTETLKPPEVMPHSTISDTVRWPATQRIYLQQALVLCNAIGMPPAALMLDIDSARIAKDAVRLANAFGQLPEARRAHLLESVLSEAKALK